MAMVVVSGVEMSIDGRTCARFVTDRLYMFLLMCVDECWVSRVICDDWNVFVYVCLIPLDSSFLLC